MYGDDEPCAGFYAIISLKKITGFELSVGVIDDVGLVAGFNIAQEIDALYYLPRFRLTFDIPGFNLANLDITSRIQDGPTKLPVKEEDTYMLDCNWAYPFATAETRWSVAGHVQYTHSADQSINGISVDDHISWLLAQARFRLNTGHYLDSPDKRYVDMEYQYWRNKQCDPDTDERVPQPVD